MAVQAGVNSKRMIQHIRRLWQKSTHGVHMVIDEIKALMRPALVCTWPRHEDGQRESIANRLYIKCTDLTRHGFTPNCRKCDHIVAYGNGHHGHNWNHSEACRTRILKALAKDEDGQRRIALAKFRAQRSIAEHIEKTADESMIDESALVLRELDPPSPKRRRPSMIDESALKRRRPSAVAQAGPAVAQAPSHKRRRPS
jgi:hypothetical protein